MDFYLIFFTVILIVLLVALIVIVGVCMFMLIREVINLYRRK